MTDLSDRVALVTGSTRGIGRAIAERFAAAGAKVVLNSRSTVDEGQALASRLDEAIYLQADVGRPSDAAMLVDRVVERYGRLDVVVNNAGAASIVPPADLDACTDELWNEMLISNLMSAWNVSRAAVPHLRVEGGNIVNITSLAGLHPVGGGISIPYSVAKAGLNHLTVLLADSLGSYGIHVNALALGAVETDLWQSDPARIREAMRTITIVGRAASPTEVSDAALLLATTRYITGHVLVADGGMRYRVPR